MKTGAKIGIAAALLGVVGVGAAAIFASRRKAGLSGALGASRFPPVKGRRRSGGMTTTHYRAKKLSIDQRIALLQNLVYEGVQDATLRKLALQITDGCKARDGECEAKAVDAWMRTNIRYTGDIAPIKLGAKGPVEGIDLFQHPKRTVEFRGGDCDDHSVLAATLLALNGIPSKFRVTASKYGAGWSHIYVVAGLPKENPGKWVAVDTTLPGNFYGTEAGYAMKKDFNALAFVKEAVT